MKAPHRGVGGVVVAAYRRPSPLLVIAAMLASGWATSCGRNSDDVIAQYRFVDPELRRQTTIDLGAGPTTVPVPKQRGGLSTLAFPTAAISDETRYVLHRPTQAIILIQRTVDIPDDGPIQLTPGLPPSLTAGHPILVRPRLRSGKMVTQLSSQIVVPSSVGGKAHVSLTIDPPPRYRGRKGSISLQGYALDWSQTTTIETPAVQIPEHATLEVGIGVLEAGYTEGAVSFTVDACDGDDCDTLLREEVDPENDGDGHRWVDLAVPLDSVAGEKRALVFRTFHKLTASDSVAFPVWANPTIFAPHTRTTGDYNVILISLDTLRADHLGVYGYQNDTSPFLDDLFGTNGAIFEHCVAAATATSASHMSMFTGLHPSEHGVRTGLERLPEWIYPLAEPIRAKKLETVAVTENAWLVANHGFARGFNVFAENKSSGVMKATGQIKETLGRARRWLRSNTDKRFFMFLHTYQVHDPFVPPSEYRSLFTDVGGVKINEKSPRHVRERLAYDQEIRYADDQMRLFIEFLAELGLDRNTVVILVSDHGEAFLEHGSLRHSTHLHEEVTRVPCMLWGPEIPRGVRISEVVGLIDIPATVLGLLEVPVPVRTHGISLLPLLSGDRMADPTRPYFSESSGKWYINRKYQMEKFMPPAYALRRGPLKLSRYQTKSGYEYELYNIADDPHEKNNLFPAEAALAADLQAELDTYPETAAAVRSRLREWAGIRGPEDEVELNPLDPAQEEKLRALGYLQ